MVHGFSPLLRDSRLHLDSVCRLASTMDLTEQALYEKEGLNVKKIEWTDNQDCIELIEGKSSGIFNLLDEESKLPTPEYDHFTGEVHNRNKNHFRLSDLTAIGITKPAHRKRLKAEIARLNIHDGIPEFRPCTYISVPQVAHTYAVILSKPSWMWGAEMGANEKGVAIGNAPVWTKLNGPRDLEKRLLGTDIVRLALERASTADEAVHVLTSLLADPGQGGPATSEKGKDGWCFHNSFLVADSACAWVVETAGSLWAAEKVEGGIRNISNELSIGTKMDMTSPGLIEEAKTLGLYSEDMGTFDFKAVFSAQSQHESTSSNSTSARFKYGRNVLEKVAASGKKCGYRDLFRILRDEDGGICMMDGGFITAGSQISVLLPPSCPAPSVHWFTGTPNPATSIYKPFFFGPGADAGTVTVSAAPSSSGGTDSDQGAAASAGIDSSIVSGSELESNLPSHALYRGHRRLCGLMDTSEERGQGVLGQLRQLEDRCAEDVDEILANFCPESFPKLRGIFHHMASMELNFYV